MKYFNFLLPFFLIQKFANYKAQEPFLINDCWMRCSREIYEKVEGIFLRGSHVVICSTKWQLLEKSWVELSSYICNSNKIKMIKLCGHNMDCASCKGLNLWNQCNSPEYLMLLILILLLWFYRLFFPSVYINFYLHVIKAV